jgi:cytochrome c nitrite reductase small subunit
MPPRRRFTRRVVILATIAAGFVGVAGGLGTFTFVYAEGSSYLTDDPEACANCHVMQEHYDRWRKSTHHAVAVCNDCHTPVGFVRKYYVKAKNGFHHSWAFTSGDFHEPIEITPSNRAVTEEKCRHCHGDMAAAIRDSCIRCHDDVGHP